MYKCHLCSLETKQLNGLLGRHWKKHCSNTYSKEQYKIDILSASGRKQPICTKCNQPTTIPKGEKDYPLRHKKCYIGDLSLKEGISNINWKGGQVSVNCATCKKELKKYISHLKRENKFCSISCSMKFYALSENRTDAQKNNDIKSATMLRELTKTDKFKEAHSKALAKMQEDKKSKVETTFLESVRITNSDAIGSHVLDFYTWDIFIPSTLELFEVQGNYWHNQESSRHRDIRKRTFLKKNRPEYKFHTIWENEILDLNEDALLEHARKRVDVIILTGPSGCGKSYLAEQLKDKFEIITYDKVSVDECISLCESKSTKIKLIDTPMQAKKIAKTLRGVGIRVWLVYLREDREIIVSRLLSRNGEITDTLDRRITRFESLKDRVFQFYGNQESVREWLLTI